MAVTFDVRKSLIATRAGRQPRPTLGVIPGMGMVRRRYEDAHDFV
jgi:hypothetical protein